MTIEEIIGKTVVKINKELNKALLFHCVTGETYKMFHQQDCCESVTIEDICGDLNDLVNTPIVQAFEKSHKASEGKIDIENYTDKVAFRLLGLKVDRCVDSCTWTFYTFSTIKGTVTIRWYGESNGYYSESVSFEKIE